MWKIILTLLGLIASALAGLELGAWFFWSSFDCGALAGIFCGAPVGGLTGLVTGLWFGDDRRGGIRQCHINRRSMVLAAVLLLIVLAVLIWMSTIRPFYWIQT